MKISYGITVHNEAEELQKLLQVLNKNIDKEDEIVVCVDGDDEKVEAVLGESLSSWQNYIVYKRKLDGNFSDQKNYVIEQCTGDYIFHIDADEYPHESLVSQLPVILEHNPENEVYLVPRVNTVSGLTKDHITQWGWRVNDKGWVNWPDYQWRVWKNKPEIKWVNRVHEKLSGHKTYAMLPDIEGLSLYHPKNIDRQEKQNAYYNTL